jgi:hypothetical protein
MRLFCHHDHALTWYSLRDFFSASHQVLDSISEITTVGSKPFVIRTEAPTTAAASLEVSSEPTVASVAATAATSPSSPSSPSAPSASSSSSTLETSRRSATHLTTSLTAEELVAFSARWRDLGETLRLQRIRDTRAALLQAQSATATATATTEVVSWTSGGGKMELGEHILLDDVTIVSPDGRLLVDHLSLTIPRGTNVMVTGTRV